MRKKKTVRVKDIAIGNEERVKKRPIRMCQWQLCDKWKVGKIGNKGQESGNERIRGMEMVEHIQKIILIDHCKRYKLSFSKCLS